MVYAQQAQLAKAFMEAGFDVVGLHECRLPSSSICVVGNTQLYTPAAMQATTDAAYGLEPGSPTSVTLLSFMKTPLAYWFPFAPRPSP